MPEDIESGSSPHADFLEEITEWYNREAAVDFLDILNVATLASAHGKKVRRKSRAKSDHSRTKVRELFAQAVALARKEGTKKDVVRKIFEGHFIDPDTGDCTNPSPEYANEALTQSQHIFIFRLRIFDTLEEGDEEN